MKDSRNERCDPRDTESIGGEYDSVLAACIERLLDGDDLDPDRLRVEYPECWEELVVDLELFLEPEGSLASAHAEPLRTIGDYSLEREIGRGGMGVVYEAWQKSVERQVALKVLPAGLAADDRAFQRFMREAKTAARLHHPHVVSVFGLGIEDNTPYYAMEYVEGETLAQVIDRAREEHPRPPALFETGDGSIDYRTTATSFAQVAAGLHHAHSRGVTHRDLKPSNLIIDRDRRLRILDFGLARLDGQESLTLSGDLIGTPLYMSPEQARRRKVTVDHRTDVYSLGVTLYETLVGEPPFQGRDAMATISRIIEDKPPAPRRREPEIPPDLELVVLRCLRKDPADRYGTAEALAQDLERFARGDPVEARPEYWARRVGRRIRRQRARWSVVTLLVTATILALSLWHSRSARERAQIRDAYESLVEEAATEIDLIMADRAIGELRLRDRSPFDWTSEFPVDRRFSRARTSRRYRSAAGRLSAAIGLAPHRPEAQYELSRLDAADGRSEQSRDRLNELLQRHPSYAPAIRLGRSLEANPKRGTIPRLAPAAHEEESSFSAALQRGLDRFEEERYEESRWELITAASLRPESLVPQILVSQAYQFEGEHELALEWVERAYRRLPLHARHEFAALVAEYWFVDDEATEVRDSLLRTKRAWMDRMDSGVARDQILTGYYLMRGDRPAAVEAARRALLADENNGFTHALLAWIYQDSPGQAEMAAEHVRKALALEGDDANVLTILAVVLHLLGDHGEAADLSRRALDRRPGDFQAASVLARALDYAGDREAAEQNLLGLLESYPDNPALLGFLSSVQSKLGKFADSVRHAERGIALDPSSAMAWMRAGYAYSRWGRPDRARYHFERALKIDPDHRWSLWGLEPLCRQEGEYERALELLCLALPQEPMYGDRGSGVRRNFSFLLRGVPKVSRFDSLDSYIESMEASYGPEDYSVVGLENMALAYLYAPTRGDPEKAVRLAERAVALSRSAGELVFAPSSALQTTLANAYFRAGRNAEAVRALERIEMSPQRPELRALLARIRGALVPRFASAESIDAKFEELGSDVVAIRGVLAAFEAQVKESGGTDEALLDYFRYRLAAVEGDCERAAQFLSDLLRDDAADRCLPVLAIQCSVEDAMNRERLASIVTRVVSDPSSDTSLGRAIRVLKSFKAPVEVSSADGRILAWDLTAPLDDPSLFHQFVGNPQASFVEVAEAVASDRSPSAICTNRNGVFAFDDESDARPGAVAYLETTIVVDRGGPAKIHIRSDDGAVCWINGEEVYRFVGARGLGAAEDSASVFLADGPNDVHVLVQNQAGPWGASVRCTDSSGRPIPIRVRLR